MNINDLTLTYTRMTSASHTLILIWCVSFALISLVLGIVMVHAETKKYENIANISGGGVVICVGLILFGLLYLPLTQYIHYESTKPVTYQMPSTTMKVTGANKLSSLTYQEPQVTVTNAEFREYDRSTPNIDYSKLAVQLDYSDIRVGDQVTVSMKYTLTQHEIDMARHNDEVDGFKVHVLKVERPTSQQKMQVIYQD